MFKRLLGIGANPNQNVVDALYEQIVAAARQRQRTGNPATEKQLSFLRSLVNERDIESLSGNLYERAFDLATDADKFISKSEASDLIGALLEAPKVEGQNEQDAPEGIHEWFGKYVKVQVAIHGSGKKYAKVFNPGLKKWDYVGREPLKDLREDTLLTAEQAAEFGHLYGMCVYCGRGLTDERSIAVGYGPICAENHGLPWG